MNISTHLKIEGENCLNWIKKNEEADLFEVYFDTEEGEIVLSFEPLCFDTLVWMIQEMAPTSQKIVRNPRHSKGRVRPSIGLYMEEDGKVSMSVDLGELREDNPVINLTYRGGKVNLGFNEAQARAIKECCEKIIEINEKTREVQKERAIPATNQA